jgi:glycosyltransferase involved in cell wall biosynthesis
MKVLYDARFITPEKTGVGGYCAFLLQSLLENTDNLDLHLIYFDRLDTEFRAKSHHQAPVAFDNHPMGDIWRNFGLIRMIRELEIDVIHHPAFYSIQRKLKTPQIVTIHDVAVFDMPHVFPSKFAWFMRKMIACSVKRAKQIIVISEFTAGRLGALFPSAKDKMRIIPYGVSDLFLQMNSSADCCVKEKWMLPDEFILDVVTIEPRKNLLTLLNAYSIYRRRCPNPLPLILAGKDGFHSEQIHCRVRERDLDLSVRLVGYVPVAEIASMYRLATMLVFPSLYEGFGLPVLEAMAGGCPVICSTVSSLPEVVGDAAILVDPHSEIAIAHAMCNVTGDAQMRLDLSLRGRNRAAQFPWARAAAETLEAYRDAVR